MHQLDLARSWMVGDTLDDVEAGHRAGCRSILFDSGGETVWRLSPLRMPAARCRDWDEVAHWIVADSIDTPALAGLTAAPSPALLRTLPTAA